jgi:hypothetical protein
MTNLDIIDRLPQELANCLLTDSFFCDIPVIVVEKGNVADEMARAQAVITETSGKRGVAVLVLQVVADDLSSNLQFGPMTLKPAFQVIENVELNNDDNGTLKSARKVARRIRDAIKTQNFIGLVQNMTTSKPCIEPVELKDLGDAIVAYQVNFECLEVGSDQMVAVQMPVIAVGTAPPQFILSCPNAGAQIWFTLDDTFPFNGDVNKYPGSTAQLFVAGTPVNIPTGGCTLRARAYGPSGTDLDGGTNISSGINRAILPN